MDTVWLRLTVINENHTFSKGINDEQRPLAIEQSFMFGPTGITRFATVGNRTVLYISRQPVATVMESNAYIMDAIKSVRNPERRVDENKVEKTKGEGKTSHTKNKNKV